MNPVSHHIMSIYHYGVMLRDTLEYTIVKDGYNVQAYEARRKALKLGIEEKSPLKNFIDTNGDIGKNIETKIKEFYDDVYSDDSTVLRVSPDGLRVDHAQHLKIYDYVVGIHETISDVTKGFLKYARDNNQQEDVIEAVIAADEKLFRSLVFMTVMSDVDKTFLEFNKAMRENQGKASPQSNYIVGDLKKLIGFLYFEKQHNTVKDGDFNDMMDGAFRMLEYIEGKRELPARELTPEEKEKYKGPLLPDGKRKATFPELFKENHAEIAKVVNRSEIAWRTIYQPLIAELVAAAPKEATPTDPVGNA